MKRLTHSQKLMPSRQKLMRTVKNLCLRDKNRETLSKIGAFETKISSKNKFSGNDCIRRSEWVSRPHASTLLNRNIDVCRSGTGLHTVESMHIRRSTKMTIISAKVLETLGNRIPSRVAKKLHVVWKQKQQQHIRRPYGNFDGFWLVNLYQQRVGL